MADAATRALHDAQPLKLRTEVNTKALLDSFTPERLEELTAQFLAFDIVKSSDMVLIIDTIFDHALREPEGKDGHKRMSVLATLCARYAERYAEFPDERKPPRYPHTFKSLLLQKCSKELERAELDALPDNQKLSKVGEKTKHRILGCMRFIGELSKQETKLLPEHFLHACILRLLVDIETPRQPYENPQADEVDCLCELMTAVGPSLDYGVSKRDCIDKYHARMKTLIANQQLPMSTRTVLQKTIELRRVWSASGPRGSPTKEAPKLDPAKESAEVDAGAQAELPAPPVEPPERSQEEEKRLKMLAQFPWPRSFSGRLLGGAVELRGNSCSGTTTGPIHQLRFS